MTPGLRKLAPIALTLALLACVAAARLVVVRTGVPEFQERSRRAVEGLSKTVGTWRGEAQPPMDAHARELLDPNADASFAFRNARTGATAYFSVVQVKDAENMTGHAPMNCYPAVNFTIDKVDHRTFTMGGMEIAPAIYSMHRELPEGRQQGVVYSFFVFPDGTIGTSLADLDRFAANYRKLAYGVAHVQVLTWNPAMTDKQRDEIFSILVGSERCLEMVRVLRTGIPK